MVFRGHRIPLLSLLHLPSSFGYLLVLLDLVRKRPWWAIEKCHISYIYGFKSIKAQQKYYKKGKYINIRFFADSILPEILQIRKIVSSVFPKRNIFIFYVPHFGIIYPQNKEVWLLYSRKWTQKSIHGMSILILEGLKSSIEKFKIEQVNLF